MKIGYVTTSCSSAAGWDSYSKGIVKAAAKHAEVIVLTSQGVKNEIEGVPIYPVLPTLNHSYRLRIQWQVFYQSLKYLRGCTVVHSLMEPFGPGAGAASYFLGAKFFLTMHGTYAIPPQGNALKPFIKRQLMRFMYHSAIIKTTGSPRNVNLVEQIFPVGECRVIPNGVDSETYRRIDTNSSPIPFLLTVGEVKPRKGVDITLQALVLLRQEFPQLQYRVVGKMNTSSPFYTKIKKHIEANDLQAQVKFLGRISDEELCLLYNQCSVFVLAAQTRQGAFEGFPLVFYEAQGCGAPIISTRGFGSEYVVKDGYNGFLVEEDDAVGLAEAIRTIMRNSDLREQMVKNSLFEASKHNWDQICPKVMEMYHDGLRATS